MHTRSVRAVLAGLLLLVSQITAVAGDPSATAPRPVVCTYQVADLVVPLLPGLREAKAQRDRLIRKITESVEPQTWAVRGGPGTIEYFPNTMALVVNQTPDVQAKVKDLIDHLRREQDVQVAVEVRFVSVGVARLDRARAVIAKGECPGPISKLIDAQEAPCQMDDMRVRRLMEDVQEDPRGSVMQAPKMTLFNGQESTFCACDERPFITGLEVAVRDGQPVFVPKVQKFTSGVKLTLQPVVSRDRRRVRMSVKASLDDVDTSAPLVPVSLQVQPAGRGRDAQPVLFTQYLQQPKAHSLVVDKAFEVKAEHTMLLSAGTRSVRENGQISVPFLCDVPLLGPLFSVKFSTLQTENVFLMVTPRLIVLSEHEERQAPAKAAAAQPRRAGQ